MKHGHRFFRKQLIIPAEHGSWSWLLVPYFTGLLASKEWHWATLLVLLGSLASFLERQPASVWVRARAGRGRKADGPLAAGWMIGLTLVALLCLLGLLALGRWAILWLIVPMLIIFTLYLTASQQRGSTTRTLWMELAGAAGLAAAAPAAYIAATGYLDGTAWALWGLMAAQNVLGVQYVRLRIADTHSRPLARPPVFWVHAIVLVLIVLLSLISILPGLTTVPFIGFFLRAIWAVVQVRPVANIKRFGFSEIGFEIIGGILIAGGWLI